MSYSLPHSNRKPRGGMTELHHTHKQVKQNLDSLHNLPLRKLYQWKIQGLLSVNERDSLIDVLRFQMPHPSPTQFSIPTFVQLLNLQ